MLIAVTCLVVVTILRPVTATADEDDKSTNAPDSTSVAPLETLGPALSLILQGEDGKTIDLRAADGRLAWNDSPYQQTQSTAYVHIGSLLSVLMKAEDRAQERQALRQHLTADAQTMRDELERIQREIEEFGPEDEEAADLIRQGQQLAQQLQAFGQQAVAQEEAKAAEQLEQCYRELVTAVNVVADRHGINTVFRFIPTDDPFNPGAVNSAMVQIRLRTLLRYPDDADITDEVADELNVDLE
jgi:Skp family chaperone for outer membrane proteins